MIRILGIKKEEIFAFRQQNALLVTNWHHWCQFVFLRHLLEESAKNVEIHAVLCKMNSLPKKTFMEVKDDEESN